MFVEDAAEPVVSLDLVDLGWRAVGERVVKGPSTSSRAPRPSRACPRPRGVWTFRTYPPQDDHTWMFVYDHVDDQPGMAAHGGPVIGSRRGALLAWNR